MASHTVGLIRDQNVNVHYNGASVAGKGNLSTAPRKGGISGRKPLGDLSNSVNRMLIQSSKKENSKILSFTEKETAVSKLAHDSSKKKSVSKASEKVQVGRKALSDISNSGKPCLKETSKKIQTSKLTILAENPSEPEDIAKEGFLHNHDECIKSQKNDKSMKDFLKLLGLEDFSKAPASAKGTHVLNEMQPMSPPRYIETQELPDLLIEDWSPPRLKMSTKLDSAPPSPGPADHYMHWNDPESKVSFELIGSP